MDLKLASLYRCKDINNEICYVIKKIAKRVIPNKSIEEKVRTDSDKILREIIQYIEPLKSKYEFDRVELHGSVAKGTWLPNRIDMDIFIVFDKPMSREVLSSLVREILKFLPFKSFFRYAEHPYLHMENVYGYDIDLVPAFDFGGKKFYSATDRTIYHTFFINKNMDPILKNEVRILKAFLIGIGCYGAEIKIGGFSGYATELLILNYKTFIDTILALKDSNDILITFSKVLPNKKALFRKFQTKFVMLDPVDLKRNVLAALRPETFNRAKLASKLFLTNPNTIFFYPKKAEPTRLDRQIKFENDRNITVIKVDFSPDTPPDKMWGIILRIVKGVKNHEEIKELDPIYVRAKEEENTVYIVVETLRDKKYRYRKIAGPPVSTSTKHIVEFLKKHKNATVGPWLEGERLYALEKQAQKHITQIIKDAIHQYIQRHKESIKSLEIYKIQQPNQINNTILKLIQSTEKWMKIK